MSVNLTHCAECSQAAMGRMPFMVCAYFFLTTTETTMTTVRTGATVNVTK